MLPRRYRLPGYQVPRVLAGKPLYRDSHLAIFALPSNLDYGRLGIVISSRFLPLAVRRNRLKRRLWGIVDPAKLTPGFDVVVLVKK